MHLSIVRSSIPTHLIKPRAKKELWDRTRRICCFSGAKKNKDVEKCFRYWGRIPEIWGNPEAVHPGNPQLQGGMFLLRRKYFPWGVPFSFSRPEKYASRVAYFSLLRGIREPDSLGGSTARHNIGNTGKYRKS